SPCPRHFPYTTLFRSLLDENLMKEAGIYLSLPKLSYADVLNDEKTIELDDSYSYKINEYDSIWSPTENELQLTQSISIKHPSKRSEEHTSELQSRFDL